MELLLLILNTKQLLGKIYFNKLSLSGEKQIIDGFQSYIRKKRNLRSRILKVDGGFHSQMLAEAKVEFLDFLSPYIIQKPILNILSTIDAKILKSPDEIKEKLAAQFTEPVQFQKAVEFCLRENVNEFYEMSYKKSLTNHVYNISSMYPEHNKP